MRYCVLKDTSIVIDGSNNPLDVMISNVKNCGYTEEQVEILTEEEFKERLALQPQPLKPPSLEQRLLAAEQALLAMMEVQ